MSPTSSGVVWHPTTVARRERWRASHLSGVTVWFTGLSGSGKSTIANEVGRLLVASGRACYLLDGDNLRHGLNGDLGFDASSREENVRRTGEVARLMADAGLAVLSPLISPYRAGREWVRAVHTSAALPFFEVYVDTPISMCEQRDPKGLYRQARAGEITGFTGIDDPYEPPEYPDLVLHPDNDAATLARSVVGLIQGTRHNPGAPST